MDSRAASSLAPMGRWSSSSIWQTTCSVFSTRPAAATWTSVRVRPSACSIRLLTCPAMRAVCSMSSIWPSTTARSECSADSTQRTRSIPSSNRPATPMTLRVPISRMNSRSFPWVFWDGCLGCPCPWGMLFFLGRPRLFPLFPALAPIGHPLPLSRPFLWIQPVYLRLRRICRCCCSSTKALSRCSTRLERSSTSQP